MGRNMLEQRIAEAQHVIERSKDAVAKGNMRQKYHFMPQVGWLNDPNGLIYYQNKYHLFYQFNPYDAYWGAMHWGHAISDDMVHWEHLPVALAPSEPYDDHERGGCFSGSAIEHDNKLYLMYTGTWKEGESFRQSQCIAYSEDGINFTKYEGNPVIPTPPEGYDTANFRDPKVWKHEDCYYMVLGGKKDNLAQALLYRSRDMLTWEFFNVLAESRGELGYMWECPDFYQVGDKYVLMFSPMGVYERTAVYLVGDMNYRTGKFTYSTIGEMDWGFDFYAPQSFVDDKNRRILIAWANAWDWMHWWKDWGPTFKEGWCGFFSIPRKVKLYKDGTLQFEPIKEMELLRGIGYNRDGFFIDKEPYLIPTVNGNTYELKLSINLERTTANRLILMLRSDGIRHTKVIINLKEQMLYTDRNNSDGWSKGVTKSPLLMRDDKVMDIHMFVDQSSIELFTDEYRTNHSINVFASESQDQNYIQGVEGGVYINQIETWELKTVM